MSINDGARIEVYEAEVNPTTGERYHVDATFVRFDYMSIGSVKAPCVVFEKSNGFLGCSSLNLVKVVRGGDDSQSR